MLFSLLKYAYFLILQLVVTFIFLIVGAVTIKPDFKDFSKDHMPKTSNEKPTEKDQQFLDSLHSSLSCCIANDLLEPSSVEILVVVKRILEYTVCTGSLGRIFFYSIYIQY